MIGFAILDDGPVAAQREFDVMEEVALLAALRIPLIAHSGGIHSDHVNAEPGCQAAFPFPRRIGNQRPNANLGTCVSGIDEFHRGKVQRRVSVVDGKFQVVCWVEGI